LSSRTKREIYIISVLNITWLASFVSNKTVLRLLLLIIYQNILILKELERFTWASSRNICI